MTFADLQTAVYDGVGLDTTDGLLTSAVVARFVNRANRFIASIHDWPWQQAVDSTVVTAAGTNIITLEADWLRTEEIRVIGPVPGTSMSFFDIDELEDRWTNQVGQPREYAIWHDQIVLGPTPDAVYTLRHRYVTIEADMSAGTDQPAMPDQLRPAIVEYATYLACRRVQEEARANVAYAAFKDLVAAMQDDRRRHTAPGRVRVRPGSLI